MGEPNLLRQPMKWRAAGVAKGVDLSTAGGKKQVPFLYICIHNTPFQHTCDLWFGFDPGEVLGPERGYRPP